MVRLGVLLFAFLRMQAQETHTGVITGTVVDDSTGASVEGAVIEVGRLTALTTTATARSDALGNFRFSGLPPGRYWIGWERDGYVRVDGYRLDGLTLDVAPSAAPPRLTVRLIAGASIEGVLLSAAGEPIDGAKVDAIESYRPAVRTDAQGRFRIAGLPSGEYRLRARLEDSVRLAHVQTQPESGRRVGPPPLVFYPDASDALRAAPFQVGKAARLSGIIFRLRSSPLVSVQGGVVDGRSGAPLAGGEIELRLADGISGFGVPRRPLDGRGAFRFDLLSRGAYQLLVYRQAGFGAPPFISTLHVGDVDVRDMTIAIRPGGRLRGRIVGPRGSVSSVWLLPSGAYSPANAEIAADGSFVWEGLAAGQWTVSLTGRPPAAPFTILAIRQQGRRVGTVAVMDGDNPPIEIETAAMLWVSGVVTDAGGAPVENATVAFDNGAERRMQRSGQGGVYKIGLPAGEFRVTAWRSMPAPGVLPPCAMAAPVRVSQEIVGLNLVLCP